MEILTPAQMKEQYPFYRDIKNVEYEDTFHLSKQKDFDLLEHLADGLNNGFIVTFEKNSKDRIVPVHISVPE